MFDEFSGEQPSSNELHEIGQGTVPSHGLGYTGAWREVGDTDRYLRRIAGGPGQSFWFRAIHDRDKGRPAVNIPGTPEQSRLARLNQTGYGIFVIINESTGTTDGTVTDVRCVFVDFDRAVEGDVLAERKARLLYLAGSPISVNIKATTGLAPMSMIVESSPGKFHIYWRTHAMPLDRFKPFQRELAHLLGGDLAVCNLSRVMRVPGFLHQKGEPFLTRVLHVRSGHPNSVGADNIERALARTMKKFKVEPEEATPLVSRPDFGIRAFEGILDFIATAPEGERNKTLHWGTRRFADHGLLAVQAAVDALTDAARQCGLDDREIAAVISGVKRRAA